MKNNLDNELIGLIRQKINSDKKDSVTVTCGITSAYVSDERNLREFFIADEINKYLKNKRIRTNFYLIDDSYDALNIRQLRLGVNKNIDLIKKYEKYCGMPISLVPDPFECHSSYSEHNQNRILNIFKNLGIKPHLFDVYKAYEKGVYDFAKDIIFKNINELNNFLLQQFPSYSMKNIFWALCPDCKKIDETHLIKVNNNQIFFECKRCKSRFRENFRKIKGKFSWKIDTAIKWNILDTSFEPFSKAYLDPTVGSFFIAKAISEEFLGGKSPVAVSFGQIAIENCLSYKITDLMPSELLRNIYLEDRKKDIKITDSKIVSFSKKYPIMNGISYFDYSKSIVPKEIFSNKQKNRKVTNMAIKFSDIILHKKLLPELPDEKLTLVKKDILEIIKIINLVLEIRKNKSLDHKKFRIFLDEQMTILSISKGELFPKIRTILSISKGIPLTKMFFYTKNSFFRDFLNILNENLL